MMKDAHRNNDDRLEPGVNIRSRWVVVAETVSRTLAEFAVNGLKSYDIPAALDSRPGFLGTAGLQLRSFKNGQIQAFKILTPEEFAEEASEIVKIFLGDKDDAGDESDRGADNVSEE